MFYAAPYNETSYGQITCYVMKRTIKEIGEYFKESHGVDPNQEFIVYRGKPSNVKNYHAHYYFKDGKFIKKPMMLEQLLTDIFS